ncbi:MAG: hypothetical protein LLF76_00005 [Planctomycetaceae bacterium]|nr:hypothetical protein [Planctomycetaceae bacterium]
MKSLNAYRLAGLAGGLLLAAGQFWGPACVLQLGALLPLMLLIVGDQRLGPAALAGFYMGIAYTIPQMIYLRMPVPVTAILLLYFTILLVILCAVAAYLLPRHPILGPLAFGAFWYIPDYINYTAVPIWGMAQSFARSWTAYPFAIQFISITSISGVLFVLGTFQGLASYSVARASCPCLPIAQKEPDNSPPAKGEPVLRSFSEEGYPEGGRGYTFAGGITFIFLLTIVLAIDAVIWFQKPDGALKVAAAGWVFDDRSAEIDPHKPEGFEKLFAAPARAASAQGARLFTSGEMSFYIADHERAEWNARFAQVARQTNMWLIVGYFNIALDENRIFFMSPAGDIVCEYTKTHLTPFEPGRQGTGDLKTIVVDGQTIGGMICQDDNFSRLTRAYGQTKAALVLCPTADWRTIKNGHLQAVRARAIECRYPIARGAACGISAIVSARGEILAKRDHYAQGPGFVCADVPVYSAITPFARFGHTPALVVCAFTLIAAVFNKTLFSTRPTCYNQPTSVKEVCSAKNEICT